MDCYVPSQRGHGRPTLTSPTLIRVHLFPAVLTLPDGRTIDPAKVIISDSKIWVYRNAVNGAELLMESLLDDLWGNVQHGYTVVVDGSRMDVKRSQHCGCGMGAFRSWMPFPVKHHGEGDEPRGRIPSPTFVARAARVAA